ncbi:MAG: hypothetical protein IIB00_04470 [candidate division Zixibacteria bacterium]|nr:hypothetical protein [candidate division Zixibacteria bacterium]
MDSRESKPENVEIQKLKGEHCINVFVSYELKSRLRELAEKYDRTIADMVRALLRIGIPVMEGISESERMMMREYVELFRKARKIKALKEI